MRDRFEIDLLDPDDPFEINGGNRPHLFKHLPAVSGRYVAVGIEEILDVYLFGDPMYEPGHEEGKADWIMIGESPGVVLKIPLAPPNEPDPSRCRPIGLDGATDEETRRHREWVKRP
jgi:hypothetical protein